jgi:hypothetical protein
LKHLNFFALQVRDAGNVGCKQSEEICCEISKAAILVLRSLDHSALFEHRPYSGTGSIDDAANFVGVMPSQTPNDRIDWIGNDLFQPQ